MRKKVLFLSSLSTVILFSLLQSSATAVKQGFNNTVYNLQQGMVVRQGQTRSGSGQLEPASLENGSHVLGITTDVPKATKESRSGKGIVFVETGGEVLALVRADQGAIVAGDKLTLSNVPGVLTKLIDPKVSAIFATAKESLNPAGAQTLKLAGENVAVTSIHVAFGEPEGNSVDPGTNKVRQFGEGIAHKDVSQVRLIFASLVCIAVVLTALFIITGGIANAFLAIGRNPLAKRTILMTLYKTVAIAIAVLVLGLASVYLILKI